MPHLTREQLVVIEQLEGAHLVLAAVGSGKTTTLSHRIARALHVGFAPERVLGLTFTNRAAGHMRAAVASVVGEARAEAVALSTFHGLCARVLREHGRLAGLPLGWRILDEDDAAAVLEGVGARPGRPACYQISADAAAIAPGAATVGGWWSGSFSANRWAAAYVAELKARGAVDFAGLVLLTRGLLAIEVVRERWSRRFDVIVVDEVQDTHLSEYEVVRTLARQSRSLCLVGDLDQTIYGWRGSEPTRVLEALKADFPEIRTHALTASFRSSPSILALADHVARGLLDRSTRALPPPGGTAGARPSLTRCEDEHDERRFLVDEARAARAAGEDLDKIAILVRTNRQAEALAADLEAAGVPHVTADALHYLRRPEVKDALALAALVANPRDTTAAQRVVQRLVQGVSARDAREMEKDCRRVGLRLTDLLDSTVTGGLVRPFEPCRTVVLDTETTGLDSAVDEVIEVAAVVHNADGSTGDRFEALLRNSVPVGDSEAIHGISDSRLGLEGRPPTEALQALRTFIDNCPISGHNVDYDLEMLRAQAARLGLEGDWVRGWDTLDLSRRLLDSPSHRLGALLQELDLEEQATHRALDDVLATVSLVNALHRRAAADTAARRAVLDRAAPHLERLRLTLDRWRAQGLPPAELIEQIVRTVVAPKSKPGAGAPLKRLIQLAGVLEADGARSVGALLDALALVRGSDQPGEIRGLRVLTMHRAKGLEFDTVFIPGLAEGSFPDARSASEPLRLAEERRLFYVAITRARRRLALSYPELDLYGRPLNPSPFLSDARDLIEVQHHQAGVGRPHRPPAEPR